MDISITSSWLDDCRIINQAQLRGSEEKDKSLVRLQPILAEAQSADQETHWIKVNHIEEYDNADHKTIELIRDLVLNSYCGNHI